MWLKRSSTSNIVIGGAAGAVPVLIGWSSVTNSIDWPPIILFLVIFLWTPPHFWALAIRYKDDYSNAEVPMLPVIEGTKVTGYRMVLYAFQVWAASLIFVPVAEMGVVYLITAIVMGAIFTPLFLSSDDKSNKKVRYAPLRILHKLHNDPLFR